ncbi:MAG: glycosyl hydrolase family 18 protein [Solirubrobacteraceae bacterium]
MAPRQAAGAPGHPTDAAAPAPRSSTPPVAAQGAPHARDPRPAGVATDVQGRVSVWLPYWNMPAALDSTLAHAGLVGTASPFWYTISGDSAIEEDPGAGETSIIDAMRRSGLRVVPTVTETDDMKDFDRLLASPSRRLAVVHALLAIAASRDYSGLDLDFEDFAVDPDHDAALAEEAAVRYPTFIAQVCGALHAIARSCTVTIMPRTTGEQVYWRGQLATWVYDYGALARVADRVRIMAYDEHAPGSPPGPVAPYRWVEQVIAYAASTMPLGKVELALAAYGYDWAGADATPITSRQALRLAAQNGVSPRWNAAQAEDTFRYAEDGREHTVWYEGATASYERARLAKAAGFAGVDLWAAGDESPSLWPMLRSLYAG